MGHGLPSKVDDWPQKLPADCCFFSGCLRFIFGTVLDDTGMENTAHLSEPLPLNKAARCLRVPARWLRDEVESGRLPGLQAGRTILVHVPTVAQRLVERAKGDLSTSGKGGDRV